MQMKGKSGEAEEIIARAKALSEEKAALAAEGDSLAREEKALRTSIYRSRMRKARSGPGFPSA